MQEILFVLIGIAIGTFTGLVPGIHLNTAALGMATIFLFPNNELIILLISMAITHSIIDIIPSVLLGAPEKENFVSVLPGHRLLLKGKAMTAIHASLIGAIIGGITAILFIPIHIQILKQFSELLAKTIPFILIAVLGIMVLSEKQNKFWAIITIILSALIGIIVLRQNLGMQNSLFAIIIGMFGCSTIIMSIRRKEKIGKQEKPNHKFELKKILPFSFLGTIGGSVISILPGMSANQAALIMNKFIGKIKTKNYLTMISSITISSTILSIFTFLAVGKARNGVMAIISQKTIIPETLVLPIILSILIAIGISALIALLISKKIISIINKTNYQLLSTIILVFLIALTFILSGTIGLIVMATATLIGIIPIAANVKRSHCMAFLIIPTIIIYLM